MAAELSGLFNQTLVEYVTAKMQQWGVPEHAQKHVIENWREIKQTLRDKVAAPLTVANMQLPLQQYIRERLSPDEQAAMYEVSENKKQAAIMAQMSDRALLEAIYKKLFW